MIRKMFVVKIMSLLILGIIPLCLLGQVEFNIQAIDNEYYKQVNLEAWRFHQYSFSQLNHNNGKANVEIPICDITAGRIYVPVKLAYNTQGIKVEDVSSVVGIGWDLIAGGRITRKIQGGLMDLADYDLIVSDTRESLGNQGNIDEIDIDITRVENRGYQKKGNREYESTENIDQAPDVFVCSAPGLSAQFFYSKLGVPYFLDNRNMKIDEIIEKDMHFQSYNNGALNFEHDEYKSFTIINEVGIKYIFSSLEINAFLSSNWSLEHNVSSWLLSDIIDPVSGQSVHFDYAEIGAIYDDYLNYDFDGNKDGCGCVNDYVGRTKSTTYNAKRISKISWGDGYIKFNYSEGNRLDCDGDKALVSVKLFNKYDQLIKDVELKQSYFTSLGGTSELYKRLKLDKVIEYSNNRNESIEYKLGYYSGNLPNRRSKEQDFWGYYNNNNASSLLPKLYFYPDMAPSFSSNLVSNCFFPERLVNSNKKYYLIDGADRSVNINVIKIGMLKDMQLPTGGKRTFDYESNLIKFGVDEVKGGGLRVCKETLENGNDSYEKIYEYGTGSVLSLPQMAHMCNANSFSIRDEAERYDFIHSNLKRSSYSFLSSFDINPYEVLYDSVKEKQLGNGEIEYNFYPLAYDYSFVNWEIQYVPNDLCSFLNYSYSNKHFTLPPRTALSGQPLYTRYFEEGNLDMVMFIQYDYKQVRKSLMSEDTYTRIGNMHTVGYINNINYTYSKALKSEETIEYYKRGGLKERTLYTYNGDFDLLIEVAKDLGNGQFDKTELKYPFDFRGDQSQQANTDPNYLLFAEMANKNINIPIFSQQYFEDINSQTSVLKGLSLNLYKSDGNNIRLSKSYKASVNARYPYNLQFDGQGKLNALSSNVFEEENEVKTYSNNKPSLIYNHQTGVSTVLEWDVNTSSQPYLVAHNAEKSDLYYESFEGKGSYNGVAYHGTLENSDASFGDYCWRPFFGQPCIGVLKDLDPNKEYWFQFWAKGNGRVSLDYLDNNGWSVSGNIWKPYAFKFKGLSIVYLVFEIEGLVDEIRIYPVGSEMLTRTQIPLVGVTSETDQNGISTYYEYDEFWRLKSIKNHDKNILTQYEYNYAKVETATTLSVSTSSITFPSMGDLPRIINVTCDGAWTVSKPIWIKMDPITGNGNTTVEILALPNREGSQRDGVIKFSIPGKSVWITVKQFGDDVLPLER